jgi:hypothetical protein
MAPTFFYPAGNAGNGGTPQADGVIIGAGARILTPEVKALVAQDPGVPAPVRSFNITQLGEKPDKVGKDTNFRGLTISRNVLYYTKGSGSNGVNTVYFGDTAGFTSNREPLACPMRSGIPFDFASLPASPLLYDPAALQTEGSFPITCASSTAPQLN